MATLNSDKQGNRAEVTVEETEPRRMERRQVQRAKSAATRAALIAVARSQFTEFGYHETGTNELVAMASVTRGALYHHFDDKRDLFEAVFRQVSEETAFRTVQAAAAHSGNLWDKFLLALESYLQLRAFDREAQRILLIEGPAVLGWERWRELQAPILDKFTITFRDLMEQKFILHLPPLALAGQILAALNDASLTIANSDDPQAMLEQQTSGILGLIRGLKIDDESC